MVSCGADKSIYFRSAEKVYRPSLLDWFYIASYMSRYYLYSFALTVYHGNIIADFSGPGFLKVTSCGGEKYII